jgi:deoxycytidylate deaminase
MPILRHIHYEIPYIYPFGRYDTSCLHFAKLFKGNKPFGQWMPNSTHMHAEHNAMRILRTQKQRKNHHLTMVVLRFDRSYQHLRLSKPCSRCVELLKSHHIYRVVYSNDNDELVKENTKDIIHKPSSMACKIPKQGRVVSLSKKKCNQE